MNSKKRRNAAVLLLSAVVVALGMVAWHLLFNVLGLYVVVGESPKQPTTVVEPTIQADQDETTSGDSKSDQTIPSAQLKKPSKQKTFEERTAGYSTSVEKQKLVDKCVKLMIDQYEAKKEEGKALTAIYDFDYEQLQPAQNQFYSLSQEYGQAMEEAKLASPADAQEVWTRVRKLKTDYEQASDHLDHLRKEVKVSLYEHLKDVREHLWSFDGVLLDAQNALRDACNTDGKFGRLSFRNGEGLNEQVMFELTTYINALNSQDPEWANLKESFYTARDELSKIRTADLLVFDGWLKTHEELRLLKEQLDPLVEEALASQTVSESLQLQIQDLSQKCKQARSKIDSINVELKKSKEPFDQKAKAFYDAFRKCILKGTSNP